MAMRSIVGRSISSALPLMGAARVVCGPGFLSPTTLHHFNYSSSSSSSSSVEGEVDEGGYDTLVRAFDSQLISMKSLFLFLSPPSAGGRFKKGADTLHRALELQRKSMDEMINYLMIESPSYWDERRYGAHGRDIGGRLSRMETMAKRLRSQLAEERSKAADTPPSIAAGDGEEGGKFFPFKVKEANREEKRVALTREDGKIFMIVKVTATWLVVTFLDTSDCGCVRLGCCVDDYSKRTEPHSVSDLHDSKPVLLGELSEKSQKTYRSLLVRYGITRSLIVNFFKFIAEAPAQIPSQTTLK